MLILKRIIYQNDFLWCDVSKQPICWGDYYYEDDKDHLIIKADVYKKYIDKFKKDTFDESMLNEAKDQYSYEKKLRDMQLKLDIDNIAGRDVLVNGKRYNYQEDYLSTLNSGENDENN